VKRAFQPAWRDVGRALRLSKTSPVLLLLLAGTLLTGATMYGNTFNYHASLPCASIPVGSVNLESDPEPQQPIWCSPPLSNTLPATGTYDAFGGFGDPFNNSGALARFNNGDDGYNVFDNLAYGGSNQSAHFLVNNYFVVDLAKQTSQVGAAISPNHAFRFENGKLVLEADVSASEVGFDQNGAAVWPEVDWSTSPAPNRNTSNDGLYLYGSFPGFAAGGCRIEPNRGLTCAVEADHVLSSTTGDQPPCYSFAPSRVMELSGFQSCGSRHSGFAVDFGAPGNAWRLCPPNSVDACMERFRFEWSQSGLVAYVNGIKFAEDSGWPGYAQLPTSIASGSTPIYAYFGQWGDFSSSSVYRFHWGQVSVNPHDAAGNLVPPSASPQFTEGQAPSQSLSPSPSPSPGPGRIPSSNAVCTVTLSSLPQTRTCSGI
jgi:hypothetical protein